MPEQGSRFAGEVDWVFYFIFWVSAAFFVLIAGLMFAFMILYRRRHPGQEATSKVSHNTPLEVTWSVIPGVILVFMFWWGFRGFMDMRTPPDNSYQINVKAVKWVWSFEYPGGIVHDELHCEVGQPVILRMQSDDVIHSCYIPAFRVKRDVVPGRISFLWFQATQPGTYPLFCAEYCGTGHSDMRTVVVVHERGEFAKWLELADPIKRLTEEQYAEYIQDPDAFIQKYQDDPEMGEVVARLQPPQAMGEKLYKKKGCANCHSVDGTPVVGGGPSFKGVLSRDTVFSDGRTLPKDRETRENYMRRSMLDPLADIVRGYDAIMPKIALTDREIDMLIAYIESIQE
ncbi:MAG: cytochrome c oxidase subunit II [Planctomycetota bacterium]|nr:MAG: cytochrome c oxidase subunit II [Planctomycetota bacterium]